MIKKLSVLAATLLISGNVAAFSLGNVPDTGKLKMQTCLMDEAKTVLTKGTVTSANLEKTAGEIAAVCAASHSMEVDPALVKQAVQVLKSLM